MNKKKLQSLVVTTEKDERLGLLPGLVGYRLRRATGAFKADYMAALEETGIRQVLFGLLAVIAARPGARQGEVGHLLGIKRPNMVTLVNELIERGLVRRKIAQNDRRAFALELTGKGEKVLKDCHRRILVHEDRMLADLSEFERGLLLALLARIPGA